MTANVPAEIRTALEKLKGEHVKALIVDLRGNQDGLFDKAVEAASLFIPKGRTVVRVIKRGPTEEAFPSTGEPILPGLPIAVLVDDSTASGAEILSAALKEDLGASLIGTHTAGKWSVQTIDDLPNGYAVKYTTGMFQSPDGHGYEGKGLSPDIDVPLDGNEVVRLQKSPSVDEKVASDLQLRAAMKLLTAKL